MTSPPASGEPSERRPDEGPPGSATFSLEGRAAPGLYFVGWLGTLLGAGLVAIASLSGGGFTSVGLGLGGVFLLTVGLMAAAGSQALERPARRARDGVADGPDETARPPGYRGPSPFLVFAASVPLTILVLVVVVGPLSLVGLATASPPAALVSVGVTALVYIGLIRLLVVGTGALTWAEIGLARPGPTALRELLSGAVLALPVVLVTALLADLLVRIVGTVPDSPLPPARDAIGFAVNLVAAAVVAPVSEEIFFRGYATTAWARGMGARPGLVRGALFFAAIHVVAIGGGSFAEAGGRVLVAFVGRLPVSFVLGWVFLRRRSLYAAIGLHATFNAALIVIAELAGRSIAT